MAKAKAKPRELTAAEREKIVDDIVRLTKKPERQEECRQRALVDIKVGRDVAKSIKEMPTREEIRLWARQFAEALKKAKRLASKFPGTFFQQSVPLVVSLDQAIDDAMAFKIAPGARSRPANYVMTFVARRARALARDFEIDDVETVAQWLYGAIADSGVKDTDFGEAFKRADKLEEELAQLNNSLNKN